MESKLGIDELMDSKIYVRNGVSFMNPKELVGEFNNIVPGDFSIQVQNPVINQNEGGSDNIAYPRYMIEGRNELVKFGDVEYQNTFGLLVAMDQNNPMIKIYSGMNVTACTNMCVFNAEHVYYQNLFDDVDKVWHRMEEYVREVQMKIDEYRIKHEVLVNTVMNDEDVNRTLGYLLRNAISVKLGTSPVVTASKLLDDRKSVYYFNGETTLYNVFNAVSQSITDTKDLLYKPDKTIGLSKLLLPQAA